jgi:hypothetical protein
MGFDRGLALRAGLIQLVAVIVIFIPLGLALPDDFFDDWGWITGPVSWLLCGLFTGSVLKLPLDRVFAAALISSIPSIVGVAADAHQVGGVVAVICFGLFCGLIPAAASGPERL